MSQKPKKVTKYCELLEQAFIDEGQQRFAIERIKVRSTENEEIRFTYYKKSEDGKLHFVPRPLDLDESSLLELFKKPGITGVFSISFLNDLRDVLDELCRSNT
ncbi:hypothetical protein [Paenibacillus sp. y28]|uniref:hypothetical protein n=1 Tax=Paenibacillus sp. y28 TaxID=3129110 RepID=UPI00301B5DCB